MGATKKRYKYDSLVRQATHGLIGKLYERDLMDRMEQRRVKNFRLYRGVFVAALIVVFGLDLDDLLILQLGLAFEWVYVLDVLLIAIFVGTSLFFSKHIEERFIRKHLSRLLRIKSLRPHFCLICDYSLKGSKALECPECGEKLAPVSKIQGPILKEVGAPEDQS